MNTIRTLTAAAALLAVAGTAHAADLPCQHDDCRFDPSLVKHSDYYTPQGAECADHPPVGGCPLTGLAGTAQATDCHSYIDAVGQTIQTCPPAKHEPSTCNQQEFVAFKACQATAALGSRSAGCNQQEFVALKAACQAGATQSTPIAADTSAAYNPQCVWEAYSDYLRGISDINVMETCHAVTPDNIKSALGFLMEITDDNGYGPTPFKDAHCRPTYSGYACEYKGITMQISR